MKRALIITYYWPPAGGPGVQRWLNFVKYLKEFDVEPVVYIPENPHYPIVDLSLVRSIPSDLEIIKRPIKEPYRLAKLFSSSKTKQISSGIITEKKPSVLEKLMLYIRGNFFIPDARIGWVKPSVNFLQTYLRQNPVDVIITTGPPHSLHIIGLQLKQNLGVKWIADFRDPWTTIHYHQSLRLTDKSKRKHKALEAQVLQSADQIVVTSKTTGEEFSGITANPITVITNGYESTDAPGLPVDSEFTIAHIGSLLSERNPEILWEILAELLMEQEAFSGKLKIKLAGTVSKEVLKSLEQKGLYKYTELPGYVSHLKAKELMHSAQLLLLVEMNRAETRAILPGKLFEYIAARRPVIAIGPAGSDISQILEETGSGHFYTYEDKEGLKKRLLQHYRSYLEGAVAGTSGMIDQYSRRELTGRLAEIIKAV